MKTASPDLAPPLPHTRSAAIVGRPNVGKSALFNRLAGRQISIVHDQPGITRDRLGAECRLGAAPFEITDTGGIGADVDVGFTQRVRAEAEIAIATATVLLLVVDARAGVTPLDADLAARLRRAGKPVLLVVNKVDEPDKHGALTADFLRLGFADVLPVSAAHGRGVRELVEAIESHLPAPVTEDEENPKTIFRHPARLALVGRPNVGKSSLTNAILGEARTIVSPISGTTRDAVDVPANFKGRPYVLIDTAGIRHRGKRDNSAEVFSAMRSEKSIRRADLCVLVIDASAGVTAQDRQIAGLIQKAGKPCLVAVNKWDLVAQTEVDAARAQNALRTGWLENARAELFFLPYAPFITVSALHDEQVGRLFTAIEKVRRAASERIPTGPLNRLLRDAFERQPPPSRANRRVKLLYATQISVGENSAAVPVPAEDDDGEPDEVAPARAPKLRPRSLIQPPAFLLFVNDPRLLTDTYRKYLENSLRVAHPYPGLPIFFKLRGRENTSDT